MVAEATLIAAVTAIIGGIVWSVRLEGRLNAHEAKDEATFEGLEKRQDDRHVEYIGRLERIEDKLDRLPTRLGNGHSDYPTR